MFFIIVNLPAVTEPVEECEDPEMPAALTNWATSKSSILPAA